MKKRLLCCVVGVACSFALGSPLSAADAPPIDFKKALTTLKNIKEKRTTDEKALESKVVQDLRTASASNATAIAFYKQAVSSMQFAGKDPVAFQQWLTAEDDKLNSEAMQNAARLHINYLLLSIQRSLGATTRQIEPGLMAHIAALNAAGGKDAAIWADREKAKDAAKNGRGPKKAGGNREPLFWEQDLITQDISSSIFVKWYGIQQMVTDIKEWELSPGNIDGMYQNTLLPYYRKNKDPRVISYWDDRIQQELQRVTNSHLAFRMDQFNNVRRPQLLWKRAVDEIALGQRNRGMAEMLELIKNTPNHPDLPDWIAKMEEMIGNMANSDAAASGTASVAKTAPQPTPPVSSETPAAN